MEIYDQNVIVTAGMNPEIHSLADVHNLHTTMIELRTNKFKEWLVGFQPHYRSEQVFGWDITPGLFRGLGQKFSPLQGKDLEKKAITDYEPAIIKKIGSNALRSIFNKTTNGKNWDLLFQAQHCGLHTSLVDWTLYVDTSIFFGVEDSSKPAIESADAQLWVYMLPETSFLNYDGSETGNCYTDYDPFALDEGFMINVPVYMNELEERVCEQRISRQGGRFYMSSAVLCNVPMNRQKEIAKNLFRFRIPAQYKSIIREELNSAGINRQTIYVKESSDHLKIGNEINKRIYGFQ
jgi:hypothetical protein